MKRRKKNKRIKYLVFLCLILGIMIVGPAYSYMRQQLELNGNAHIFDNNYQDCGGSLTYDITSWGSDGQYTYKLSFNLANTSESDYNFWDISFDIPEDTIINSTSSTNAEIIGNKMYAHNVEYNGSILVGNSTIFEIQLTTSVADYKPTSLSINNCYLDDGNTGDGGETGGNGEGGNTGNGGETGDNEEEEIVNPSFNLDNLSVTFKETGNYGTYIYHYDVTLVNISEETVSNWNFMINKSLNTKLNGYWNVNYVDHKDYIEFSNVGYNSTIEPGGSVSFGIIIETDDANFVPTVIK